MKRLPLLLYLTASVAVADAQSSFQAASRVMKNDQSAGAQLQLSTSVIQERYSEEAGAKLLRLTVKLNYSNIGSRPILLDKKSSMVYRKLVSRSLRDASKMNYVYDETSSFIDVRSMQVVGMQPDGSPEKESFINLKPQESYSLKNELILRLYNGTSDTEDFLRAGTHFLQIKVATWYYFADPELYRDKWSAEGYLWSQDVTSVPMPLTIKKSW